MSGLLKFGSYGDEVKLLQAALNLWPASKQAPLNVDAAFGQKTLSKTKEFQSGSRLAPDGVVGPLTWAQLEPLVQAIKKIAPIPTDEAAAGERIVAGAEAALAAWGWTANDAYSPINPKIAAAKCADASSPARPRQGGQSLAQIFAVAQAPGNYQQRCPTISGDAVSKWQDQTMAGTQWRNANDLCAWCGIFCVYVLRVTGFTIPNGWGSQQTYVKEAQAAFWKKGSGSVYRLFTNPAEAFRGCVGVINPSGRNHHFIVTGNDGGSITSIDGNSSGFGMEPDPKMKFDCKSIIGRNRYKHSELREGQAYFLFPAPGNR
jgi:peptidoglycan hydrolase-like protein with peptidoglycan-binding domain